MTAVKGYPYASQWSYKYFFNNHLMQIIVLNLIKMTIVDVRRLSETG